MAEHILMTMPMPQPGEPLDALKAKHPNATWTFVKTEWTQKNCPPETYADATILYTFLAVPPTLECAPNLKWIHFVGAGIDRALDAVHWTSSKVPFTTSSGVAAPQIAEWVVLAEAAQRRNLAMLQTHAAAHSWAMSDPAANAVLMSGRSTVGLRVGIFGYGAIGRQVARVLTAQGAVVLAHTARPRLTPADRVDDVPVRAGLGDPAGELPAQWFHGTTRADVHAFLSAGIDWLVVCAPLTQATRGVIGAPELALLAERRAFVTNVARGELLDHAALAAALRPRPDGGPSVLRGAHLDVTAPEPLPAESELWEIENCTITPHVAALDGKLVEGAYLLFGEVLGRFLERGEDGLVNVVSRVSGY